MRPVEGVEPYGIQMTCNEAQAFLGDFLEEQLCLCAMVVIGEHVQSCPTCLEELRKLMALKKLTDYLKGQRDH